ncbi:MAG: SIS domain-containing protein [Porticoccaceae bacterium]|nr:SIS domain-containing protein [Porticoccaceae bacterium]
MDQLVFQHLQNHIETTMTMGENCAIKIVDAAEKLTQTLLSGQTIYSCGVGETAPLSQLFVHYLTAGYQIERPGFPAIDLGDLISMGQGDKSLANLIHIHGQNSDILVVFSSGNDNPLFINAIDAAIQKGLIVLLISATNDVLISQGLSQQDIEISCTDYGEDSNSAVNFLIIQCLCTLIDNKIFGGN